MSKLNLGCADHYIDGWHNVDLHAPTRVDERVDLTTPLPWGDGMFTHIYAGHILEHLTLSDAELLLHRLRECTAPDGVLMIVGPDVDLAEAMIVAGTFDGRYHSLQSIRFGDDRWQGTQHQWDCTAGELMRMARAAGWHNVTEVAITDVPADWPVIDRNQLWQCAVQATA